MNARQLLLDTLDGKRTDRVPVAPFIYNNLANEYHGGNVRRSDCGYGCSLSPVRV